MERRSKNRKTHQITFRVENSIFKIISKMALDEKISVHECARNLLMQYFAQEDIRSELAYINEQISNIGTDMADFHEAQARVLEEVNGKLD